MAIPVPSNPDLPSSILIPGVYIKLNFVGGSGAINNPSRRLLLVGCKTSSGTASQDTVIGPVTQQSDANTYCGRGSDLARKYAAAASAVVPGSVDIFLLPIAELSSGTAATHLIVVAGPATSAGYIQATICGYTASAQIANSDTATTIAANLNTQIQNLLKDTPITSNASSGTITLTYNTKGLHGNDLPRIVNLQSATGVTVSPGTITYTTTATSGGAITVSIGGTTISYTVTNTDTVTTTAAGVAAAINAGGFPVTATASSGTVTLLYATDRVVHRIAASMGTVTGTTVAVACGTVGAGVPSLTNALANLVTQQAFPVWSSSLNDGGSGSSFHNGAGATSSIGAIATHITTYASGYYQKGQRMFFGSTEALAVAGGYQTSTGVQGSGDTDGRFAEIWQVDSPQQALELSARAAAVHIVQNYLPQNYDGMALRTAGAVPFLQPHRSTRSGIADQNAALLTYYMTPILVNEAGNYQYILRDRNTSTNTDQRVWRWGIIATIDFIRADLAQRLNIIFQGKSFKPSGVAPRTPNTVTVLSIREACAEIYKSYDALDFLDDTDNLIKGITAAQDGVVTTRVNLQTPLRIPVPLDQIGGTLNLQ